MEKDGRTLRRMKGYVEGWKNMEEDERLWRRMERIGIRMKV